MIPDYNPTASWWITDDRSFSEKQKAEQDRMALSRYGRTSTLAVGPNVKSSWELLREAKGRKNATPGDVAA